MTRLPFATNPYRERAYALRALVGSVETAAWWLRRACAAQAA